MSDLNSVLMILIPIGVGLALGHVLFRERGGSAPAVYSAIGAATGAFWVAVGVFMIVGGLEIVGMVVIIVFYYLGRGNYTRYKQEGGIRTAIAGDDS